MPNTMFFSLLLNIGLLVLIATLLTHVPFVRRLLLNSNNPVSGQIALALIFGAISIVSTYTGVRAQGAIVNTRVIGVLAAGLLGGPYAGMGAAVIGGMHRYLFDIGGFTASSRADWTERASFSSPQRRRWPRWRSSSSSPAPSRQPWIWCG